MAGFEGQKRQSDSVFGGNWEWEWLRGEAFGIGGWVLFLGPYSNFSVHMLGPNLKMSHKRTVRLS